MLPKEISKLCTQHKVKWRQFDTFYNLLYTLSKYDPDLCGKYLEISADYNISLELMRYK